MESGLELLTELGVYSTEDKLRLFVESGESTFSDLSSVIRFGLNDEELDEFIFGKFLLQSKESGPFSYQKIPVCLDFSKNFPTRNQISILTRLQSLSHQKVKDDFNALLNYLLIDPDIDLVKKKKLKGIKGSKKKKSKKKKKSSLNFSKSSKEEDEEKDEDDDESSMMTKKTIIENILAPPLASPPITSAVLRLLPSFHVLFVDTKSLLSSPSFSSSSTIRSHNKNNKNDNKNNPLSEYDVASVDTIESGDSEMTSSKYSKAMKIQRSIGHFLTNFEQDEEHKVRERDQKNYI